MMVDYTDEYFWTMVSPDTKIGATPVVQSPFAAAATAPAGPQSAPQPTHAHSASGNLLKLAPLP